MGHATRADRELDGPHPGDAFAILRRELDPGETVAWQGRPRWHRFVWASLWSLPAGLAFGGGPLALATFVTQADGVTPMMSPIFAVPFVVIGGLVALAPAWHCGRAARTRYAITDRRVIRVVARFPGGTETRTWPGDAIRSLLRTERRDGSGDLVFEEVLGRDDNGHVQVMERGFYGIEDVRRVEAILRATLQTDRPVS